jgi:hypothetical protein
MFLKKWKFVLYLLFFLGLSLIFHRDVIFNSYNYGRHWDWTFYSLSDYYANYLHSFFYAIKINALGYVDILSINFAELTIKFFIYSFFRLLFLIPGIALSIPIMNKLAVFVLLPMLASVGMWYLCRRVMRDHYHSHPLFFFLIAIFANIAYTFSLVVIFDLHGGALNRQIGSAFFPWFFLVLYTYYESSDPVYLDYRVILLGLSSVFFDISNIFYIGVLSLIAIALKRTSLKVKIVHLLLLGVVVVGVNTYWLQGLFFGDVLDRSALVQERKLDINILRNYSVPYSDVLSMLNTPHNLANRTFENNILKLVPYVSIYIIIFLCLLRSAIFRRRKRLSLFLMLLYLTTTILVTGVYGIGGIYNILYSFEFLGFIRSSVRYMPNLAIATVFIFLVILKITYHNFQNITKKHYIMFLLPFLFWLTFLVSNSRMISLVNERVVGNGQYNHEIGALYEYDPTAYEQIKYDKLLYNVIPVPSWFSPLFLDNIYPKTSQGSDTDNFFVNKGEIVTFGQSFFAPSNLEMFIKSKVAPSYFSIINVKAVWFKNQIPVPDLDPSLYFGPEWMKQTIGKSEELDTAIRKHTIYKLSENIFLPRVYIPDTIVTTDKPLIYLPTLVNQYQHNLKTTFVFSKQNQGKITSKDDTVVSVSQTPVVEFRQLNPAKYRIRIHNAVDSFPLVVSVPYHDEWKLYAVPPAPTNISRQYADTYKVLKGNEDSQASLQQLQDYIEKGRVSSLGDKSLKNIVHTEYNNGTEKLAYREPYYIDYVSKNYNGTIQNENLPGVGLFEPWSGIHLKLDDYRHLKVNGYSNAWNINTSAICHTQGYCTDSIGEGRDMEFIMVFESQKEYQTGIIVSISIIMLCILYCCYQMLYPTHRRHENTK